MNLFCSVLIYWIKFSRSRKEIYSFSSHLIKFFVTLQRKIYISGTETRKYSGPGAAAGTGAAAAT